jgi:hypothetical protein
MATAEPKQETNFVKVVSMGHLDLELILSLTEEEMKRFNVPEISSINSLADCEKFLFPAESEEEIKKKQDEEEKQRESNKKNSDQKTIKEKEETILDFIRLNSTNSTITAMLMINKAFKKKTFIEYLTLSETVYKEEEEFMREVIKYVTEQNYLFIIENGVFEIPSKIKFTIKLAETKDSNFIKTFELQLDGRKEDKQEPTTNLYNTLNYDFDFTNFFYMDLNSNFEIGKYGFTMQLYSEFVKSLTDNFKDICIVTNFPDIISNVSNLNMEGISSINEILEYTDVFIFEKKEALALFNLLASLKESAVNNIEEKKNIELLFIKEVNKKRKNLPKIGIFIDELKKLTIIEQQAKSNLILFHSDFDLKFIPDKISKDIIEEYKKLLVVHHQELKFTFIGGFLSRIFYKRSFSTCFTAGSESVKRILELLRFQLDYPIDNNYYIIRIKKPGHSANSQAIKEKQDEDLIKVRKEQHFVLDCVNKETSSMRTYNPLYDQNLQSFFSSHTIRSHLKKLGFINRKGQVLQDPDFKKLGIIKNKKLVKIYEDEQKKLIKIKENNYKMKLQIHNLFHGGTNNLQNVGLNDLEKYTKVYNFHPISGKKLPSISGAVFNFVTSKSPGKHVRKSPSPLRNDLYAKAIEENNKKAQAQAQVHAQIRKSRSPPKKLNYKVRNNFSNGNKAKNLKPLSKENYLQILDNYESKIINKVTKTENKQDQQLKVKMKEETQEKKNSGKNVPIVKQDTKLSKYNSKSNLNSVTITQQENLNTKTMEEAKEKESQTHLLNKNTTQENKEILITQEKNVKQDEINKEESKKEISV